MNDKTLKMPPQCARVGGVNHKLPVVKVVVGQER
jgi:hypothetical protein